MMSSPASGATGRNRRTAYSVASARNTTAASRQLVRCCAGAWRSSSQAIQPSTISANTLNTCRRMCRSGQSTRNAKMQAMKAAAISSGRHSGSGCCKCSATPRSIIRPQPATAALPASTAGSSGR
ncbi:hypothetical protein G6F55_013752 [Rhizopus delemar]|nr:hypothetical protein G6F55_013752 [Rhizopus delemar]